MRHRTGRTNRGIDERFVLQNVGLTEEIQSRRGAPYWAAMPLITRSPGAL